MWFQDGGEGKRNPNLISPSNQLGHFKIPASAAPGFADTLQEDYTPNGTAGVSFHYMLQLLPENFEPLITRNQEIGNIYYLGMIN